MGLDKWVPAPYTMQAAEFRVDDNQQTSIYELIALAFFAYPKRCAK